MENRENLLNAIWEHQLNHGYLDQGFFSSAAERFGISEVEVEGVASFYHFFHQKPLGKHVIYVNNSIVSEIKGYDRIIEAFERETGARLGSTDPTGTFSLFSTSCIGLSDHEPAALIDFHPFTHLTGMKVKQIVQALKEGSKPAEIADEVPSNQRLRPRSDKAIFFREHIPGKSLSRLFDISQDAFIDMLKEAGVVGMGGAFFPSHIKMNACKTHPAEKKYVVCNADEGEPGTFKDRELLQYYPELVIEGMIIAGYVIGSDEGIIYLRAEYRWLKDKVEAALERYKAEGWLGRPVEGLNGFTFSIRIQMGAGAYVCGEETALINSLEGKRGEPRAKLFFPTDRGFRDLPTLVQNVETLAVYSRLLEYGPDHFKQLGEPGSFGTKIISVSGDVDRPGLYEIEWGMTVRELLEQAGAEDPYYLQVSGPSGTCIGPDEFDRKLSITDLKCAGSFMVFNRKRNVFDILKNFAQFYKMESCGVCTPCRAGNFLVERMLIKMEEGLAEHQDYKDLEEWGKTIRATSRCGLGRMTTNSLEKALDKFPEFFEDRVTKEDGMIKPFDLERATEAYEKFKD